MALAKFPTNAIVMPTNMKLVGQVGTAPVFQKKKSSRSRFKTPLAVRKKISASARKFKFPLLTAAANAGPAIGAFTALQTVIKPEVDMFTKQKAIVNLVLAPYTGVQYIGTRLEFQPRRLMEGLVPNLIVLGIKKLGIFRGINQTLARSRIPIRLA